MEASNIILLLNQPNKAGPEHGICGGDKGSAQGFVRGKGSLNLLGEGGGHFGGVGGDGAEEEVVVMGHGGVVEEGCVVGGAGVFEEDVFGYAIFVRGTFKDMSVSV